MSDTTSHSDSQEQAAAPSTSPKRKVTAAGLDGHGHGPGHGRSVKRRAAKACQCCRARKVRCNVTEHGAPCTNCRLDEVECIVSESRRRKKWTKDEENHSDVAASDNVHANRKLASRDALDGLSQLGNSSAGSTATSTTPTQKSHDQERSEHVPHSIYQSHGHKLNLGFQQGVINRRMSISSQSNLGMLGYGRLPSGTPAPAFSQYSPKVAITASLPFYIKSLPTRIGPDEIAYLEKKGALTTPANGLRNELLRAYIEFVHPYMPLLDLHDFLAVVDRTDGSAGRISLILFQAVMFAGSAFVDMQHLRNAGYLSRKEARKDFFQKVRLLYDFDYESDRVVLVQAILLLTYYYETPDDQKDTWHWMGVATSVAHTIGLHRNPERSNMDVKRVKLWKRIWWSTYMRDRLIALGMRRPTRIKSEDYDVPMLTLNDFEIAAIPASISCVPADCAVARNVDLQRTLAILCISKAKLSLCISHVLSKQYCVLNNNSQLLADRTTMMLLPKKLDPETCEVKLCDDLLQTWVDELPPEAQYYETSSGSTSVDLHRSLLHMVFYTTLSALHRPQVLQPSPVSTPTGVGSEMLDMSRRAVRRAASAITSMATNLDSLNLVHYLPTTGVTVLLPAIIIHLLDIKAPDEETRRNSLRGFYQCMQVMGKLRELYAAADYSTAFLEAAIRKAGIHLPSFHPASQPSPIHPAQKPRHIQTVEDLVDAGRRLDLQQLALHRAHNTLTPPPEPTISGSATDLLHPSNAAVHPVSDEEVAQRLESFLASTPPSSGESTASSIPHCQSQQQQDEAIIQHQPFSLHAQLITSANMIPEDLDTPDSATPDMPFPELEQADFDALLNLDATLGGEGWDEGFVGVGVGVAMQGESSGFVGEMEWVRG
ncbi:hypothetical protein M501DRAFT_928147 [Patellaria atrata CBS 101060]|uniref:Zn(2)-C6 fungal-type domain-containing protein n=1 Tax=Patellaria atrata CBS 101060 TaxID=1346257 RepID=A0A9P4SGC4_9PEZI|nr:hypothetical protein M501DRAFT_928147 [Patellaria atrata CBS 101060]